MIYLLFTVLFAEMMIILLLLFETPIREPLVAGLGGFKQGKAQLVVKSFGATVFLVMMYNIYTIVEIRSCSVNAVVSPNRVILAYHILEASLMGVSLFLLLIIDSLPQRMKKIISLTNTIKAERKQNQAYKDIDRKNAHLAKSIKEAISKLNTEMTKLESECGRKEKDIQSRKANSEDLKSQLQGLHVEYDHLLTENKDLKDQLQDIKEKLSHSSSKKIGFFSWDLWGL
ncbi:hypothetical protein L2E82_02281 [Cichorium intybus]|uniref:Uncharacterized protein n=1 Tax=Cichorium intybus TaxID=13427 RepID=A0ACB9H1C3_CICIN|nr:hypothetical protein L2E82_02281 [Cichorium intybus]